MMIDKNKVIIHHGDTETQRMILEKELTKEIIGSVSRVTVINLSEIIWDEDRSRSSFYKFQYT